MPSDNGTPSDYLVGTKLEFEVRAVGPGEATLNASFTAEVVLPPGPRRVSTEIPARGQRRPPYELSYVFEEKFDTPTRWGAETWNASHASAFTDKTAISLISFCRRDADSFGKPSRSLNVHALLGQQGIF